jgi:hypothetical protein
MQPKSCHHRVGHCADQIARDLELILLLQESFDLTPRHALRIHRDDLGVEADQKSLLPLKSATWL